MSPGSIKFYRRRHQRYHPHVNVTNWSPNHYNGRGGAHPTLIVVHATAGHNRPGIIDLVGLGNYFSTHAADVCSHVATDNEGHSARYCHDRDAAWHVANYNRVALGIEQVIPGDGTEVTEALYHETARWLAHFSHYHGIPIRQARVSGLHVARSGVIRHSQLGAAGGGHADPGRFDLHHCMALGRFYLGRGY